MLWRVINTRFLSRPHKNSDCLNNILLLFISLLFFFLGYSLETKRFSRDGRSFFFVEEMDREAGLNAGALLEHKPDTPLWGPVVEQKVSHTVEAGAAEHTDPAARLFQSVPYAQVERSHSVKPPPPRFIFLFYFVGAGVPFFFSSEKQIVVPSYCAPVWSTFPRDRPKTTTTTMAVVAVSPNGLNKGGNGMQLENLINKCESIVFS